MPLGSGKNYSLSIPDLKPLHEKRPMLKLNYTSVGLYMERTMTAPEMLIARACRPGNAVRVWSKTVARRLAQWRAGLGMVKGGAGQFP